MGIRSRVLWRGSVPVSSVRVVGEAVSNRVVVPEIEAKIEVEWERQLNRALERGMEYFDSESYRLNDFRATDSEMTLMLAPAQYRIHAAMKALASDARIDESHVDRQVIVDGLVRTSDDMLVLHSVEKVVESETYLIGGSCSKRRMAIETGDDLARYTLDRVDHTLGLEADERKIGNLRGIVQNEIGCIHLIFDVFLALDASGILSRFRPDATTRALEFVPAADFQARTEASSGYISVIGDLPTASGV